MARDKHITSGTIRKAAADLQLAVKPQVLAIKNNVRTTTVEFPGFGVLGIGFKAAHDRMQEYAQTYLQAAADELDEFAGQLGQAADTWRRCEEANTVQVR